MGEVFNISYVKGLKDEDGEFHSGETTGDLRRIKISLDQNKTNEILERTLLHEIIHGILYMSGQTELLGEKEEEALVVTLENGLNQLYKRR